MPHFMHLHSNDVTEELMEEGRRQYMLHGKAPLRRRVILSAENLFERAEMFWRLKLGAVQCGIIVVLREMIRSGEYFPSCTWVKATTGSGMDLHRAQSIFRMIREYELCSSDDVHSVFFNEKADHMSHGRLIKTPRMQMLESEAFCDEDNSVADVQRGIDAIKSQITKLQEMLQTKENKVREHQLLEEAQVAELRRETHNPRKCLVCEGHGVGLVRPDGYCQSCFEKKEEHEARRAAKGKVPAPVEDLVDSSDSDTEDGAPPPRVAEKLKLGGGNGARDEDIAHLLAAMKQARREESRRMRRLRESDLRDDGAGPSRITGDGSAGVKEASRCAGVFTRKLFDQGLMPTGRPRGKNDVIMTGEDNERVAFDTFVRRERQDVYDKQRAEGIGVKPHGPRLPREDDFVEKVVFKESVVLVEKDSEARGDSDDVGIQRAENMKKRKSVTWKHIEEIVAPGREARNASYKRRRELTGNAFGGADFVNLTTGAPSWSNAGEGAKQEDMVDLTVDDDI